MEQIDQLNGQEQNAQQKYERELADYYTQLEQKGNAYNTAYTQDYGRYQDYLGQLDSLYGYYDGTGTAGGGPPPAGIQQCG